MPPLPGEGSRKSRRLMGLPLLPTAGGDTVRATRFITLEERLAGHVHATTPRVTPGRLTRESFDTAPLQKREYAADKQKYDASPLGQARFQRRRASLRPTI
jgi:hypothetical protein